MLVNSATLDNSHHFKFLGIPLAFYTKMCFASYIYLKPHRLFDVTQLCRKTRGPSGLNCVIGYPCALISRINGAIRNIANNVASMFTRTCRLFSIVVTSPKYTFAIYTLVTGATLHDLSKFSSDLRISASQAIL